MTATRMVLGATCFKISSILPKLESSRLVNPVYISAWPRKAFDPARPDLIGSSWHDDRDRSGQLHQNRNGAPPKRKNGVWFQLDQIGCVGAHQIHVVRGPAFVELDVVVFHPPQPEKLFSESLNAGLDFNV